MKEKSATQKLAKDAPQKTIQSIYTDGACAGNPGPGGWGSVVYFSDGSRRELGGAAPDTTNNRMELQAAIAVLEFLQTCPPQSPVPLYTDSEYVKKGITQWVGRWKQKSWKTAQGKPVVNQDLWQKLDQLNASWIDWRYVRGHSGNEGNERCDQIARAFSLGQSPTLHHPTDPMADFSASPNPSAIDSSDEVSATPKRSTLQHLIETLRIADEIATQGYLISSAELAELMDINASAVTSRGDEWVWRNWVISRVRREGNQILWQLERISP